VLECTPESDLAGAGSVVVGGDAETHSGHDFAGDDEVEAGIHVDRSNDGFNSGRSCLLRWLKSNLTWMKRDEVCDPACDADLVEIVIGDVLLDLIVDGAWDLCQ
jgi:hypothetical protein